MSWILAGIDAHLEHRLSLPTKDELEDSLRETIRQQAEQINRLKTMSVVEMMCENYNVDAHIREWEARCLKAEDTVQQQAERIAALEQLQCASALALADLEAWKTEAQWAADFILNPDVIRKDLRRAQRILDGKVGPAPQSPMIEVGTIANQALLDTPGVVERIQDGEVGA